MNPGRTAIVHPWVVEVRGGEKVFFELARAFPDADLYVMFARRDAIPDDLGPRLHTSFLQRLPVPRNSYRTLLPLLPPAVESLPLQDYDLIISSSSGWTHGAKADTSQQHVCYMHTPPRYLWNESPPTKMGRLAGPLLSRLRDWDHSAAARVGRFIANSVATANRIESTYGRQADVLYPPVDVAHFLSLEHEPRDYVVYVGELVPYKRVDRVIKACQSLKIPLVIVGDGPQRSKLEVLAAGSDVKFLGRVDDAARDEALKHAAVFAYGGVEDFGIAFVEAMAAGVPIAGVREGGLAEIGQLGGVAFATEASPAGLADAIAECLEHPTKYVARELALRFDASVFREGIESAVSGVPCRD